MRFSSIVNRAHAFTRSSKWLNTAGCFDGRCWACGLQRMAVVICRPRFVHAVQNAGQPVTLRFPGERVAHFVCSYGHAASQLLMACSITSPDPPESRA